jgi:hypothetical protein
VPPFVGEAVKVTGVPAKTGLADAVMDTLTGSSGFTIIVMVLDVAGFPVVHVALEVTTHVTALPLEGLNE